MKKLKFSVHIHAPREHVWETMLSPLTYQAWTAAFCEGSYFEGSWDTGQRIRFLAPNGKGMTAVIAENRTNEYISIKHLGFIDGGIEDTQSEQVRSWVPAFENYTFRDADGVTELTIDQDIADEYEKYMVETWPKALEKLKELCEANKSVGM